MIKGFVFHMRKNRDIVFLTLSIVSDFQKFHICNKRSCSERIMNESCLWRAFVKSCTRINGLDFKIKTITYMRKHSKTKFKNRMFKNIMIEGGMCDPIIKKKIRVG